MNFKWAVIDKYVTFLFLWNCLIWYIYTIYFLQYLERDRPINPFCPTDFVENLLWIVTNCKPSTHLKSNHQTGQVYRHTGGICSPVFSWLLSNMQYTIHRIEYMFWWFYNIFKPIYTWYIFLLYMTINCFMTICPGVSHWHGIRIYTYMCLPF